MDTLAILKGEVPKLGSLEDLSSLWWVVYDGPVGWQGRSAFEQIAYLQDEVSRLQDKLDRYAAYWNEAYGRSSSAPHL